MHVSNRGCHELRLTEHMHPYAHIRTHTYIYAHILTYTHTYSHMRTHLHTYARFIHVSKRNEEGPISGHAHAYTHLRTHTRVFIYADVYVSKWDCAGSLIGRMHANARMRTHAHRDKPAILCSVHPLARGALRCLRSVIHLSPVHACVLVIPLLQNVPKYTRGLSQHPRSPPCPVFFNPRAAYVIGHFP